MSVRKFSSYRKNNYLDYNQARDQDGWILAKFFFRVCLWTETELRSINTQKWPRFSTRPRYSHLDRTSLVNRGLLHGKRTLFSSFAQFSLRENDVFIPCNKRDIGHYNPSNIFTRA